MPETKIESTVCKFSCREVRLLEGGNQRVIMQAQYDEKLDEDRRFANATPDGQLEIYITNQNVIGFFEPGKKYYLTLTPAEEVKP